MGMMLWRAKVFVYFPDGSFQKMIVYHNIATTDKHIEQFENMLRRQFPGLHHVNYYDERTKDFKKQTRP
jgi:hypothetical protein